METKQIISWLYDKAARAQDHSYARMLNLTAKRLQELDEKKRWIPVTERLPEELKNVLAYTDVGCFAETAHWTGFRWEKTWDFEVLYGVTHWMPLPEPPKEVE